LAIVAILVSPLAAPQLLAFPYVVQSNGDTVYSVAPVDRRALDRVTARANALVAKSPLARTAEPRSIFLTDGGWRWSLLALGNSTTLALTRPLREAVIVRRSDLRADQVPTAFGTRTLSGIIAHEKCHGMERRHFGLTVDWTKPQWLREGYCDVVGAESTLSDEQARRLIASGQKAPALIYWQGRKRVETTLAANGGDVDALFASARSRR
jgi:hypothetical protein